MKDGDLVKLSAYGGEEIVRRVVLVMPQHVGVSSDEEIEEARVQERPPRIVGFHKSLVIEVVEAA